MSEIKNTIELISVVCPNCGNKTFSFSENALSEKRDMIFVCSECASNVQISKTHEGNIFVQSFL